MWCTVRLWLCYNNASSYRARSPTKVKSYDAHRRMTLKWKMYRRAETRRRKTNRKRWRRSFLSQNNAEKLYNARIVAKRHKLCVLTSHHQPRWWMRCVIQHLRLWANEAIIANKCTRTHRHFDQNEFNRCRYYEPGQNWAKPYDHPNSKRT